MIDLLTFPIPRYLAREDQSGPYSISRLKANLYVSTACLSYLCFRCFDRDITDEEVGEFILSGEYTLFDYTRLYYLHHIRATGWRLAGVASDLDLETVVQRFLKLHWNASFKRSGQESTSTAATRSNSSECLNQAASAHEMLNIIAMHAWSKTFMKDEDG